MIKKLQCIFRIKPYIIKQKFKQNNDANNRHLREVKINHLFIFILVILNVILAVLVLFVGYVTYKDIQYNLPLLSKKTVLEFSVPCDDLSLSPDEDLVTFAVGKDNLSVSISSGGKYVCGGKHVAGLLKKVVERETRLRHAKGLGQQLYLSCGNESLAPHSGYLTVALTQISNHESFSGNGVDSIVHWQSTSDVYANTVVQQNGEINITQGRMYFVYSSVHIDMSRAGGNETENAYKLRTFSLRICRKIFGYEQTLLGETRRFDLSGGQVVSSFSIASHLELNRNDIIYVKVSNANCIIPNSKGNTFGIFPL